MRVRFRAAMSGSAGASLSPRPQTRAHVRWLGRVRLLRAFMTRICDRERGMRVTWTYPRSLWTNKHAASNDHCKFSLFRAP